VAAAPGVVFDIHAPVITLSGFADGTYYNGDISILVTIADFSPVDSTITLNGAAIGNASLITEPGRYTLAAQARDSFGLSTSVVRGFVIDKSAPYLAIISPANGLITNQDVSVIYTSTDDFSAAGQLLIRDDQNRAPPFAYTAEGVKTTTITVTDQAGNISTAAVTFTIDKTAPAPVTDFRLNSFLIASGNVDLIFTAPADNISGVADYVIKAATFPISAGNFDAAPVLIQGIPAQAPGTPEPYIIPVSTSFTLYFALKSRDFAGNISGISNAVIMDVQPPTLTAIDPAPSWFINRPSTFSVQAADDISVSSVVFSVDGVVVSTLSAPPYLFKWDILSFADGNHTLTARAEDAAGNRTTVSSVYYVLYQPPSVPVISSPYSGFSVAIPTFTITGTGEPGTTVQVRINGSVLVSTPVASDGSYTAIVTLPTEGSYTLAVFAADSRGAGSASAPISIEYNVTAPNAPSSVSAASMPGGKVRLTWLAPSGKAPAHYRVYRSDSETALVSGAPAVTGLLIAGPVTALTLDNTPSADGFYYYAVTAHDAAGNESVLSDVAYSLSDSVVPSASVTLPGITPPLGAGAYPVQVIVSEVLTAAPYFTFTPSGGAPIQISLEPSVIANIWVATLTITQAMPSGTGSFSFQGTDLSGNSGQTITSGSALALETSGPVANIAFIPAAGPSLKAGQYSLKLTLNEPAAATPGFYSIGAITETVYVSSSTDAAVWDGVINISTATGEGVHNFAWTALDSLGNAGTLISGATYFIADTVPPGAPMSLNWSFGAGGAVLLNWSGVGEKPASYCVYRDSTLLNCSVLPGGAGLTGAFTDIPPQEGGHAYHVTALDKAGNESLPSNGVTAQSDATPPSAPASISASPAEAGGVDITWSSGPGEAPSGFRLYRSTTVITSVSGLAYRALVGSQSTDQPQTDGVYHYAISAVDLAGNESAVSVSTPVSYDKAAPVIALTGIVDGGYYMAPVNPAYAAYDLNLDTSTLAARLDGLPFTSGSPVITAGGHSLTVSASDLSGHTASKTVSFSIDLSSPVITLSGIANGGYYTAAVTPIISASDLNLSSVTALLNGQVYTSGSAITDNGAYTLEITATDRAGNNTHISAAFNVDLPPQKAQNLAALIEDGAALTLSWTTAGAGVSVYKVFKDGVYLGPVGTDKNYYKDTAYTAGAHVYEVLAVDSKGRDGVRARAEIPAVSLALAGYGSFLGDSEALNKGFFDYVRFTITNAGTQAVSAGPLVLTVGGVQAVPAQTVTVQSGGSAETAAVVYTSAQAAGTLSAKGVLTLPQGGDAAISAAINFIMATRDAQSPVVEVLPDALVRGSYSNVRVKFNNCGSAPVDIVTARKIGGVTSASDSVSAKLLTLSGLLLAQTPLTQTNADMVSSGGDVIYFVRIMPGGSYTFEPIKLAVSELAESVTVMGAVNGFAYSLNYNPVYATQVYTASNDVKTELAVPYTATIYPEHPIYDQSSSIKIMGHVKDVWENILSSFPVVVSIGNNGYTRTMQTITDSTGDYNVTFTPNPGESGIYSLGVRHPDIVGDAATSSFTIVGFGFNYTDYSLTMLQGSSYPFEVILKNTGGSPLEGLVFSVEPISGDGVTLTPNQGLPQILQPGWQMKIGLTCAAGVSATHGRMNFNVHDSNGFMRTMPITVTVVAPQVIPKVTPQVFSLGMLAGDSRIQTITVANIGFTTWTNVNVMNPTLSWVKVDGMSGLIKSLGSIPPGGTASFTLKIEPPSDQATQAYAQNPLVNIISDNFQTVAINACITVTSARNASVYFNVTNADKQPLDPTRFISGANITLTSLDIAGLSMTGKTDANGFVALSNVPAGKYTYRVESTGAQTVTNTIIIDPGLDQTLNILLPTSMVTYTWSVTPTTVVDKYDITLDMTFKTDVPAPAIVITPPLISKDMVGGQTLYVQYTLTNRGLISVFDFQLEPEMIDPAVKLELPFTSIPEIKPGQTITVPVKIYLDHASCHEARINHRGRYMCAAGNWTDIVIETLRILVGNECLGGGGGSGSETTTIGAIGGAAGGGGNAGTVYRGISAADAAYLNADTQQNIGCGGNCINGTIAGCDVCQSCQRGICQFNASNNTRCTTSDVCKIAQCVNEESGKCAITDNSTDTNIRVSRGTIDILRCSHRIPKPGYGDIDPDSDAINTDSLIRERLGINGCGSAASNRVVPNVVSICGVEVSFLKSCNRHDACYAKCNSDRNLCDDVLSEQIKNECRRVLGDRTRIVYIQGQTPIIRRCADECSDLGDVYRSAVRGWNMGIGLIPGAQAPYAGGQQTGCTCCP